MDEVLQAFKIQHRQKKTAEGKTLDAIVYMIKERKEIVVEHRIENGEVRRERWPAAYSRSRRDARHNFLMIRVVLGFAQLGGGDRSSIVWRSFSLTFGLGVNPFWRGVEGVN